ncbi:Uncharacterized protein dnm_056600 [Desulfonema magnum]|uniref:Uncharacterized protein n=1 Tax=Desulfonema magnum TaxID=45655 RepID=A0A975BQZ8_9BACT|nr:Uncharacterized protein dnm_056600 [Desulfonema magnum]
MNHSTNNRDELNTDCNPCSTHPCCFVLTYEIIKAAPARHKNFI